MAIMQIKNEELNCTLEYLMVDDEPWFKGKVVAQVLGYKDSKKALVAHVDPGDKSKLGEFSKGGDLPPLRGNAKNAIMINESGLYSLILSSKLPKAKAFKRWATKDVLPSIRKTGRYEMPKPIDPLDNRRMKLEEMKAYTDVYKSIDCPKLKTVIKDWMHNAILDQKAITNETEKYARDITDICKEEFGFTPNFGQKIKIGQVLKKEYLKTFDEPLLKYEKYVNGNMRKVNAYPKDKEQWIIDTLKNYDEW